MVDECSASRARYTDVLVALARGRHCLVLTQWTAQVAVLADLLRGAGHDPVVLRGGTGAGRRRDALERLRPDDRSLGFPGSEHDTQHPPPPLHDEAFEPTPALAWMRPLPPPGANR